MIRLISFHQHPMALTHSALLSVQGHRAILREPWWTAGQWTLAPPLAQAWWRTPSTVRLRIMAGAWMLISFVLATIYRSNLKAMLILPYINLPFNSVEELVQTDILCYVLEESVYLANIKVEDRIWTVSLPPSIRRSKHTINFSLALQAAEPGTAVNKLQKQLVIHGDDVRAARDFHQGKMAAISSTFTLWTLTTRSCDYYIADTLFTTSTSSFSFFFPKGSELKPIVNSILRRLMEGGIIDHLLQSNFHEAKKCYKKLSITSTATLRPLELGDFYGIFSLFGGVPVCIEPVGWEVAVRETEAHSLGPDDAALNLQVNFSRNKAKHSISV
ncbi:glutamate receptor 4-like [Portunus trituberculatus]|uniref:glutamate receptor 4-like n=1 Tax=Portunus trituberculatus TaxID=210409 RepID=UPI001E1CD70B|nr:glutamate receptor 4-like [Portunus trituberculatus]